MAGQREAGDAAAARKRGKRARKSPQSRSAIAVSNSRLVGRSGGN
jgi:hypothetical protein